MRKYCFFLTILFAALVFPELSRAQYIVDYKQQGDAYFSQQNYYAAAFYYEKALTLLPDSTGKTYYLPYNVVDNREQKKREQNGEKYQYLVYQLGEAFRLYKDFENAEKWYAQTLKFKNDRFPLARLWYAVCLRADRKYQQAIEELKIFQSSYKPDDQYSRRAILEIKSCRYALREIKYPRLLSMKKLPKPVNADTGSNYAAIQINDTLFFTSSRPYKKVNTKRHSPFINKIYKTPVFPNGDYGSPKVLNISPKALIRQAAPSLNAAENRIYLTEWEKAEKKEDVAHYQIAVSQRDAEGKWMLAQKLGPPVNIAGSNSKEASITANGKYLIFSSNRPGGAGGYDLWYCRMDKAGQPIGEAMNLGSVINSRGDEVSPFYNTGQATLVYSSNGRIGIGGFDVFQSRGNLDANTWNEPENLGYPVNSSKDDIFYYPVKGERYFYLSSDRNSTCCLALYQIRLKKLSITGQVFDKKTGAVISGAKVVLKDALSDTLLGSALADAHGRYRFRLLNERPIELHFSQKNYLPQDIKVTTENLKKADTVYYQNGYLIAFERRKPIVIRNIYYDFDKASLRPKSIQALDTLVLLLKDNRNWIVEIGAHTDRIGSARYNQWLSQQRAQSVVDYLVDKGIPKDRLIAKGYGELRPIAPNKHPDGSDNPEGRQLNRRTEFMIIGIKYEQGRKTEKELYKSIIGDKHNIEVDNSLIPSLSRRR